MQKFSSLSTRFALTGILAAGTGSLAFAQTTLTYATPPAQPDVVVAAYTDTTVGAPTFNRPITGSPPFILSSIGTDVNYSAYTFTAPVTANYNFLSVGTAPAAWDNFTVLYNGSFDPAAPAANGILANDDFPAAGRSGFDGVALTGGNQYVFVTTAFFNGDAGTFANTITQRGLSAGGDIPDASPAGLNLTLNVPDAAQIVSLNSVTLTGLTHTWTGDLVATLTHGGKTITLLDRVGKDDDHILGNSENLDGDYTFVPGADDFPKLNSTNSVVPSGTYAPYTNPFGNSTFSGDFGVFAGLDVSGDWVLNISDRAFLDTGALQGFNFGVTVVPEPGMLSLLLPMLGAAGGLALRRRRN